MIGFKTSRQARWVPRCITKFIQFRQILSPKQFQRTIIRVDGLQKTKACSNKGKRADYCFRTKKNRCDFFELLQPRAAGYARRKEPVHKLMMGEVGCSLPVARQFATLAATTYGTCKTQHGDQNMFGKKN